MKKYYHICSKGLEKNVIFLDREDFISGVNDIAVSRLKFDVVILCFCLMSNHFHFILYGTEEAGYGFVLEYKRRCGMRMRQKRMEVNALHELSVSINEIGNMEYLENAIAYVLRNPLAAKIIMMPYHYKWSSADSYFRGNGKASGIRLNAFSIRKKHRVLKSKMDVPDSYLVDEEGMILPECFVDVKQVEEIFRHPSRLMYLLAKKLEAEVEIKFGIAEQVSYTDAELSSLVNEMIRNEYGVRSVGDLTNEQRIRLCVLLRKNFSASAKQISRITRVDLSVVHKVI